MPNEWFMQMPAETQLNHVLASTWADIDIPTMAWACQQVSGSRAVPSEDLVRNSAVQIVNILGQLPAEVNIRDVLAEMRFECRARLKNKTGKAK